MSELQEIGIPVVEHCNINCKGCLHFCHRKQLPYFADINKLEKDLNRLHSFFDNIKTIRLYGGEPLLHKELYKFIICCKKIYVDSEIEILTNGLLLMDISSKLIETLKEYSVKIYWSVYPVINEEKYNQILKFIEINSLNCVINKVTEFYTCFDFTGNIDAYKAFERCSGKHCHILREGKISCCPAPLVGHLINKFGAGIDFSDG
ncbi:MAG: radical SAM protein, partial [Lachnospiraceae bacterium]|nr:radical SAM protein [Lachnospiraceae bacterium]